MHFLFDATDLKQSVNGTLKIVLDEVHFVVNPYNFLPLVPYANSFFPIFLPPRKNNFQNSTPLDTSAIALSSMFSSNLSHS